MADLHNLSRSTITSRAAVASDADLVAIALAGRSAAAASPDDPEGPEGLVH